MAGNQQQPRHPFDATCPTEQEARLQMALEQSAADKEVLHKALLNGVSGTMALLDVIKLNQDQIELIDEDRQRLQSMLDQEREEKHQERVARVRAETILELRQSMETMLTEHLDFWKARVAEERKQRQEKETEWQEKEREWQERERELQRELQMIREEVEEEEDEEEEPESEP